jgi:hypothetical protein
MQRICLGCKIIWLRYVVLGFTLLVGLFFGAPASMLFIVHTKNYCAGRTTNERFAKKGRSSSVATDESSMVDDNSEIDGNELLGDKQPVRRRAKKGCWANCGQMCCNKKIISQQKLLELHTADSALSSQTGDSSLA